jgi:hypothetical protein
MLPGYCRAHSTFRIFLFAACEFMILFPRPLIKHFAKGGAFSAKIEQLNAAAI